MTSSPSPQQHQDDNLWLEDIDGEKQLDWARAQNALTVQAYAQSPAFEALQQGILEVLDSDDRIPMVRKIGPRFYYNFWRDKDHTKGLWRRTTLDEYRKPQPVWETVIDLDALAAADKENWVWHGADCLEPDYRRCLISLSRGGADADVVREFDLETKQFVAGGFSLPEAKNHVGWKDIDHLYVATDFGPGSMTSSSYPRIVKEWKRGTPLASAVTVYEGAHEDMSVSAYRDNTPGFERDFVSRQIDFYESETWLRGADGKLAKIDVPDDSLAEITREWMLIEPRTDWTVGGTTYKSGSLLAAKFDDYMAGRRELTVLFEPDDTTALDSHSWTRHHLIVNVMHDVVNRLEVLTPPSNGKGAWTRESLGGAPALSTIAAGGIDEDESYLETALRELHEEAGITAFAAQVGPPVWRRSASFRYRRGRRLQHEVVVKVQLEGPGRAIDEAGRLDYEREDYFDFRWWSCAEIIASRERFHPGRLPALITRFLAGEEIDEPFELWS